MADMKLFSIFTKSFMCQINDNKSALDLTVLRSQFAFKHLSIYLSTY